MRMLCGHGRYATVDGPSAIMHSNGIKCDAPADKDAGGQVVSLGVLTFTPEQIWNKAHQARTMCVGDPYQRDGQRGAWPLPGTVIFKVR